MKNVFHWLAAAVVAASLPVTAQVAPDDVMGDHSGIRPHFSGEPGPGLVLGPWSRGRDFAFRHHDDGRFCGRDFDRDDRFFHRHRFFADFRFFGFGYPYDWYRDYYGYPYYFGYPLDYSYYDYSPVYSDRYSSNLAMMAQAELARRGYYRGPINLTL